MLRPCQHRLLYGSTTDKAAVTASVSGSPCWRLGSPGSGGGESPAGEGRCLVCRSRLPAVGSCSFPPRSPLHTKALACMPHWPQR